MADTFAVGTMGTRPAYIQVSPGMLWTNIRKPPDGQLLQVSGYASGPMDQRVYGPAPVTVSGAFIGATIGDSNFSYRPTFVDISIETASAKVEKVLNTEESRCTFSVAELTAENMNLAIPVGTLSSTADTIQVGQNIRTLKVGGLQLTPPQTIAFISPNRRISAGGPHSYVYCAYNAVAIDGFDMPFSRGSVTVFRLTFEAIAATERTIGDQLFQFSVRQA